MTMPSPYLMLSDAVTPVDIRRITERMLMSKPSIVGYGDLKNLPSFEKFDKAVAERSLKPMNASRSLFMSR